MSDHALMWLIVLLCAYECWILTLEYFYDRNKDEIKKRRTRTTKKVTTAPDGQQVTTEEIETTEGGK